MPDRVPYGVTGGGEAAHARGVHGSRAARIAVRALGLRAGVGADRAVASPR
ncbi:hypothetical protein SCALM49S_10320 [Streptomyces californicus]